MSLTMDDAALLCPSAPASAGASLIGVVQNDKVVKLGTPLTVDQDFIEQSGSGATLESRFRFSNTCQQGRCAHWVGSQCSLIGRVEQDILREFGTMAEATLPRCAIRGECRWWAQRGAAACNVCDFVITDTSFPLLA